MIQLPYKVREWAARQVEMTNDAIRARILEIEGTMPPMEEVAKNAKMLNFRDGSRALVYKGRFILTERTVDMLPVFTSVDIPYEPNKPVVSAPSGQNVEGHAGSGPGVPTPEFRSFQTGGIGLGEDGGGGRGAAEQVEVPPGEKEKAWLQYYSRIAGRCERYLKCYNEFFPEHVVDLGQHIEGIEAALAAVPE